MGDGVRLPRHPRGQGEEGGDGRRNALRHARLLPQHAARQAQGPALAQGPGPRLRFRLDQPQSFLRSLHPHGELLRELADEGGRRAVGSRADAAHHAWRAGFRRGARPGLPAGQERRLGPGPQIAARSEQAARRGGLDHQERGAGQCARRAADAGSAQFRAGLRAADRALSQESQAARHRSQTTHGGPRAISAADEKLRLRRHDGALQHARHAGRRAPLLFRLGRRQYGRLAQPRRNHRSRRRCAGRAGDCGQEPRGAHDRGARARPRAPRRPLLGTPLVQGLEHHRLLGQVLAARNEAPFRSRGAGHVVV